MLSKFSGGGRQKCANLTGKKVIALYLGDKKVKIIKGKNIKKNKSRFYEFAINYFSNFALADTKEVDKKDQLF